METPGRSNEVWDAFSANAAASGHWIEVCYGAEEGRGGRLAPPWESLPEPAEELPHFPSSEGRLEKPAQEGAAVPTRLAGATIAKPV